MTRFLVALAAITLFPILTRADVVSAGTLMNVLVSTSGLLNASPTTAVAPTGQGMIAWTSISPASAPTLTVVFFNAAGAIVSGPLAVTLSAGQSPSTCVAGASSTGFMLVFDATPNAATALRDVFFRTYSLTGTQTGSGIANVVTASDDFRPSCDGTTNGDFVISFARRLSLGMSQGVFVRRFTSIGVAVDAAEVRVDDPAQTAGYHDATAVGIWPSGNIVVVWMDGQSGAAPGVLTVDGQGQGILARFLNSSLVPTSPQITVNSSVLLDQFEPNVATDDRNRCIIGWCGDTNPTLVDAYYRRFSNANVALDTTDVNATTANTASSQFLMSVCMTSNGESGATWMDGASTIGQPGPRCGFVRVSATGATIESALLESGGPSNETHAFPRMACDQYGNLLAAWQVSYTISPTQTNIGVRARRLSRNMLNFGLSPVPVGGVTTIFLDSPSDAGAPYLVAASLGTGPLPLDTRSIKLSLDPIFDLSVFQGGAGVFFNFIGSLSMTGTSNNPALSVPNIPSLANITLYFAFATGGAGAPNGVNTISDTRSLLIQ